MQGNLLNRMGDEMGDIGFTATWPADPKFDEPDIDLVQLANDEQLRLERDERQMLLEDHVMFSTSSYEELSRLLCNAGRMDAEELKAGINDLFMKVAGLVAKELVSNPHSDFWRKE